MTPTTPAVVAEGLTEAMKRHLQRFADQLCREEYADGRTLQALDRRGLTYRYANPSDFRDVRVAVTNLGKQVAIHLQESSSGR